MNDSIKAMMAMTCLALSAGLYAPTSLGADLTIRFSGNFIEPGCKVALANVDLGEAKASDFTGSFNSAWVNVPITITGCADLVKTARLSFSGTPDANRPAVYAGRAGVGVDLRVEADGASLGPGSGPVDAPISDGGAAIKYAARMTQTAAGVTPGTLSTPVTVSVTYQ